MNVVVTSLRRTSEKAEPFLNAEEAWFWFIAAMKAREDGARFTAGMGKAVRPCEPVDIYKAMERLYRMRRLQIDHIKILRHYGRRGVAPDQYYAREMIAYRLWCEALHILETSLRAKGIVQ
jgi:hypothetical protein